MDPQFQELAREIAEAVEKRLQTVFVDSEGRIKTHIDEFKIGAEERMKMHFENLEEKVKLAGDGYVGTLEGIERELSELNKKVDTKFGDHDLVLVDHNQRIVKLEKR
jgi:5-formaminoimidazole-4-carboxamide-1-beta-D-ribofuranosyl 5'-monophosphate synthetase